MSDSFQPHGLPCGLPGSFVHRISQARILEWVAILFYGIFLNQGSNPGLFALQAETI